jgi:hypothetical protein
MLGDDPTCSLATPRRTIADNHRPLPPRLAPLKAILAKLEPPKARPERPPPFKSYTTPSAGKRRRRGRRYAP